MPNKIEVLYYDGRLDADSVDIECDFLRDLGAKTGWAAYKERN